MAHKNRITEMSRHLAVMRHAGFKVSVADDGQILVSGGWPLTPNQQTWIKKNTHLIIECLQQADNTNG